MRLPSRQCVSSVVQVPRLPSLWAMLQNRSHCHYYQHRDRRPHPPHHQHHHLESEKTTVALHGKRVGAARQTGRRCRRCTTNGSALHRLGSPVQRSADFVALCSTNFRRRAARGSVAKLAGGSEVQFSAAQTSLRSAQLTSDDFAHQLLQRRPSTHKFGRLHCAGRLANHIFPRAQILKLKYS